MSLKKEPPSGLCPVTGLPVINRPEWTDVNFGKDFTETASLIGDMILLSQSSGYATRHDVENALELLSDVVTTGIPTGHPYIHIEDFSNLSRASLDARKYYIEFMKKREGLLGLIFCGASPMLKMSIMLGKRLNIVKFEVKLVKDYSEAVELALQMLSNVKTEPEDSSAKVTAKPSFVVSREKPSSRVITHADWSLQLDGFSARFEIIDNDIFHVDTNGFLQEDHIEPLFKMYESVINLNPLPENNYYFMGGVTDLKASRRARSLYYDYIMKWYKDHPFQMYIFYGANRFLRAAINLASPFVPFPVHLIEDLDDTLDFIAKDKSDKMKPASPSADNEAVIESFESRLIRPYVDECLQFLGSINWETDGYDDSRDVEDPHPFKPVFDAIALIKMDLDDLLQERNYAEESLRESEERYRGLFENSTDFVYTLDLEGNFTSVNKAAESLTGYTRAELTQMNFKDYTSRDAYEKLFKAFHKVFQEGKPLKDYPLDVIVKDGTKKYFEISTSPIKKGNRIIGTYY